MQLVRREKFRETGEDQPARRIMKPQDLTAQSGEWRAAVDRKYRSIRHSCHVRICPRRARLAEGQVSIDRGRAAPPVRCWTTATTPNAPSEAGG